VTASAATARRSTSLDVALTIGIVVATLTTAVIHFSLGGLLFLANAAGYVTLAVALVAPLAIADKVRWLTRFALLGFTLATIVGWVVMGPRFPLAYLTKGIEIGLVVMITVAILRAHGGPAGVVRQLMTLIPSRIRGGAAASA
jgi:hypothetical protein